MKVVTGVELRKQIKKERGVKMLSVYENKNAMSALTKGQNHMALQFSI